MIHFDHSHSSPPAHLSLHTPKIPAIYTVGHFAARPTADAAPPAVVRHLASLVIRHLAQHPLALTQRDAQLGATPAAASPQYGCPSSVIAVSLAWGVLPRHRQRVIVLLGVFCLDIDLKGRKGLPQCSWHANFCQ